MVGRCSLPQVKPLELFAGIAVTAAGVGVNRGVAVVFHFLPVASIPAQMLAVPVQCFPQGGDHQNGFHALHIAASARHPGQVLHQSSGLPIAPGVIPLAVQAADGGFVTTGQHFQKFVVGQRAVTVRRPLPAAGDKGQLGQHLRRKFSVVLGGVPEQRLGPQR